MKGRSLLSRQPTSSSLPVLQRKEAGPGPALAPPIVHGVPGAPGRPLEPETRSFMESRSGHDFGKVRVHADAQVRMPGATPGLRLQRAPAKIKGCDTDKEQKLLAAHGLGVAMVGRAAAATEASAETIEEPVKTLGRRWFKLEPPAEMPHMLKLWKHVFRGIASLAECADDTKYRCGRRVDQFAIAWPGRMSVLQPLFDLPDAEQRAAVLIHEWGHMCGRGIRRLFERYCGREKFAAFPPKKLVEMPDAYMGFIFELSERKELPAGVCFGDVSAAPGGELPADFFDPKEPPSGTEGTGGTEVEEGTGSPEKEASD